MGNGLTMTGAAAVEAGAVQKPDELDWLLQKVAALKPSVVCELGTDTGWTFRALAETCEEMIGIDIGQGRWASGPACTDERIIMGDSHGPVTLHDLKARLAGRVIDFLLIDGDHSFEGVAEDYWTYTPLARWVALHDVATHDAEMGVGVAAFWERVKHRHPEAELFISEPTTWGGYVFFRGGA